MLPLIVAAGLLLLIWGVVFFRRGGFVGGCLATLGTGSCLGHPFFHVSAITLDRLLLAVLGIAFVIHRLFRERRPKTFSVHDGLLFAFLLALIGSTFAGNWRLHDGQPVATLLFFYLMPLAMYWMASRCTLDVRSHRWILGFFSLFGLYLAVTALCEVTGLTAFVFPKYIASPAHSEFLGRARGPLLNPVGNGLYLTAAVLMTIMWWPFVHKRYRPLVLGAVVLQCIGGAATLTRSVWLGLGLALVGLVTLVAPRQHRLRILVVTCCLGAVVLLAKGDSLSRFKRDKNVSVAEMAQSAKLRPILAAYAYEMFRDHPWTGCGFGQYSQVNMDYLTARSFDVPMEKAKTYVQHSVFLSLLAETGIIGLGLFLLVLTVWMADGWTLWHDANRQLWQRQLGLCSFLLLIAYLPNGMFHEMSLIPMVNMLIFFVAGTTRGILSQPAAFLRD